VTEVAPQSCIIIMQINWPPTKCIAWYWPVLHTLQSIAQDRKTCFFPAGKPKAECMCQPCALLPDRQRDIICLWRYNKSYHCYIIKEQKRNIISIWLKTVEDKNILLSIVSDDKLMWNFQTAELSTFFLKLILKS